MIYRSRSTRIRYVQIAIFCMICSCYSDLSTSENFLDKVSNSSIESTVTSEEIEDVAEADIYQYSGLNHLGHPTLRPLRANCTPPEIERFPQPFLSPWVRKHGGIIIHILLAIFTFVGLEIICHDYFVPSIVRIFEELKLSSDVAGATFMATGSSAPELATLIIGVIYAKDDIGVSGVIGSAVFNNMFVISVCALCSGTVLQLNWWPLVRDCTCYSISILIMLFVMYNNAISWQEALFMLLCYVFYCIALYFNSALENMVRQYILRQLPSHQEQLSLQNIDVTRPQQVLREQTSEVEYNDDTAAIIIVNSAWNADNKPSTAHDQSVNSWNSSQNDSCGDDKAQNYGYIQSEVENDFPSRDQPKIIYKMKEPKEQQSELIDPLLKPENADIFAMISWYIEYPIHYLCRLTIPDVKKDQYKNYYFLTFLISMIWILFYSYFMVWMITIIGYTFGIPDTIMGLTFFAAGVSLPDALSSIAVIKEGYGDMAISNAVGSNVFDILVCLGLPWFIQTGLIAPGSHVNVISKGFAYSALLLLLTVLFLLLTVHMNSWKLDKKLGIDLMFWYLFFIIIASMYEFNVFGFMNPSQCHSNY